MKKTRVQQPTNFQQTSTRVFNPPHWGGKVLNDFLGSAHQLVSLVQIAQANRFGDGILCTRGSCRDQMKMAWQKLCPEIPIHDVTTRFHIMNFLIKSGDRIAPESQTLFNQTQKT